MKEMQASEEYVPSSLRNKIKHRQHEAFRVTRLYSVKGRPFSQVKWKH